MALRPDVRKIWDDYLASAANDYADRLAFRTYYDPVLDEVRTEGVDMAVFDPREGLDAFGRKTSSIEDRITRGREELKAAVELSAEQKDAEYRLALARTSEWKLRRAEQLRQEAEYRRAMMRAQLAADPQERNPRYIVTRPDGTIVPVTNEPLDVMPVAPEPPKPDPKPKVDPTVARFSGIDFGDD